MVYFENLVFSKPNIKNSIPFEFSETLSSQCFDCRWPRTKRLYFSFGLYDTHPLDLCVFEPFQPITSTCKCKNLIPNQESKKLNRKIKKTSVEDLTDYGKIMVKVLKSLNRIKEKHRTLNIDDIFNILRNQLIPQEYLGSRKNQEFFFKLVDKFIQQTYKECVHVTELYEPYNCSRIPWLQKFEKERQPEILKQTNIYMIQTVVKPLLKYYFVFETNQTNRVGIIPRSKYFQTRHKYETKLVISGYIEPIEKNRPVQIRGHLKFNQKNDSTEFRPLVLLDKRHKSNLVINNLKLKLKLLIERMLELRDGYWVSVSLYKKWTNFCELKQDKKLYAIKQDVQDAFGNTNLDEVKSIIQGDNEIFTHDDKKYLFSYISSQYVRRGRRIYKWTHGVLQGDRLSNFLAEIYLIRTENYHLSSFFKSTNLYHRTVDDILLITTNRNELFRLENIASQVFILNERKTVKYFDIDDDPNIVYIGHLFNIETRETSYNYQFGSAPVRFHIWRIYDQIPKTEAFTFLMKNMQFTTVSYVFKNFYLGANNSTKKIVENIFEGMCFLATKLDYQILAIKYAFTNDQRLPETVLYVVANVLDMLASILNSLIKRNNPDKLIEKSLGLRVLKWIGLRAFMAVFKTRSGTYKEVFPTLKLALNHFYVSHKKLRLGMPAKYFLSLPEKFIRIKKKVQRIQEK